MKLIRMRISNFQSFGPEATVIDLEGMTFLLGPNGAGKTAVLQAITRMFGFDPLLRRIRRSDFHVDATVPATGQPETRTLWIEAQFEFPETQDADAKTATVPVHFAHMLLETADGLPRMRVRLSAQMDEDGEIEEALNFVVQTDANDEPVHSVLVPKVGRSAIHVHYLPARRDPAEQVSYAANSLLGRMLRAADWQAQRDVIVGLTQQISQTLGGHAAIIGLGERMAKQWSALHSGTYYANPTLSFERNEIDNLLRHLTVSYSPGHEEPSVDFSRLSDGQQSLLYVSLVLAVQAIGRDVLADQLDAFDVARLRPPVFTLVAMEEPENSLSPHYLGRLTKALGTFAGHHDAQVLIATQAPSLLKRVAPEQIRYLRLDAARHTQVTQITMPDKTDVGYKFVREAVQAYPELYFSRLVILGEGDSEEIVLPRLLQAMDMEADETSVSVVPLGGRHVHHFWRLLHGLDIAHVTLLDLDLARHQGGWGRVHYALSQLLKFPAIAGKLQEGDLEHVPKWNGADNVLTSTDGVGWRGFLEKKGIFFSTPLDLDFAMLLHFQSAYGVDPAKLNDPDESTLKAVLGKGHGAIDPYTADQRKLFGTYHRRFKLGSKPAAHLTALAELDAFDLDLTCPEEFRRLLVQVKDKLAALPE